MKFAEKKEAYARLQNAEMLEKDVALLRYKKPDSTALKNAIVNREKAQKDIIWELLDVATVEEILKNREIGIGNQKSGIESHSDQVIDLMNEEGPDYTDKKYDVPPYLPENEGVSANTDLGEPKKKEKFQVWFKKKPNIRR